MFEVYMNKSDKYMTKAIECFKNKDVDLARFFKNASDEFKEKALNLKIGE